MTIAAPPSSIPRAHRRLLLAGCAAAGLCLAAGQAGAQAFSATPTTVAGTVSYDRATPGVETISVQTPTAIINWDPKLGGNPIVFLPAGNVATFTSGANANDYVVLNRILTTTPIRFDGTVLSLIQDAALGTSRTGGTVLFSSPGGIIIGPTAVFDVGSLVLTSLNVVDDGAGNFYDPATRGFKFAPVVGAPANAAVITQAGAQIRALEPGSFVAMVAPVIQHGGSVRVNGSAAYVAGEQVELRVNQGLFDIIVDTGSDNAGPLTHTGTTGGPASTGAADPHNIYLVAVPKNQAITAVLQGDIGFDPAVNAAVENGAIILSAGANVVNGQIDRYGHLTGVAAPDLAASFQIVGGTIRSDLFGYARTDMLASASATGTLTFLQDVSLFGGSTASLSAGVSQTIDVMGDALVSAAAFDSADPAIINLVGGKASIAATGGGAIHIFGDATVDASARGLLGPANDAGNGTGGTAELRAAGGAIIVDGDTAILATGTGGTNAGGASSNGGAGFGGNASLVASAGGAVTAKGKVDIDVGGTATAADGSLNLAGATGAGGSIVVAGSGGGTLTVAGPLTAGANGQGGDLQGGAGPGGGLGAGGTINVSAATNGAVNLGVAGFSATGRGGVGPNGGRGQGGGIVFDANGATIAFSGAASAAAQGFGGDFGFASGGQGGTGQGGTIQMTAHAGAAASRIAGGALSVDAGGFGGQGGNASAAITGGRGGDGLGGAIALLAEGGNGTLDFGATSAFAQGTGGMGGFADANIGGGTGGNGTGGSVLLGTKAGAGPVSPTGGARFASVDLRATGIGGRGGTGQGQGGNGTGGSTALSADGAPVVSTGTTALESDARAGAGGDSISGAIGPAGQAAAGQLLLSATGAGGTLTAGTVTGSVAATGAPGSANVAGEWHVDASAGGAVSLANLTLTASANGTPTTPAFSSLEPRGGTITIAQLATLTTPGEIRLTADGVGRIAGGKYVLNAGGDVTITHANPVANGFTVDVTDLIVTAGDDFSAGAGVVTRTSGQTDIRAVHNAGISGRILGPQILIGSSDIDVAATGAIGDAATQMVTLLVAPSATLGPAQFTLIGGTTQGPGYTLTGAEAGRIRAGTLGIVAPALGASPARAPDVVIRDLTLNGGGAAAGIGTLQIATPGILRVEGNLLMAVARAQDGISIAAAERLEIATPTGSVRVRDPAGAPGGTMLLASNNIWIASQAIIDQLRLNPNYAGRDGDLADNGGAEVPRGYVEAAGVTLAPGATLYVQNSGSSLPFSSDYAGVTVGGGGLTIRSTGNGVNVTAFGRRLNPDGSFTTGDAFFAQSSYATTGVPLATGFTGAAALNKCLIVAGICPAKAPGDPVPGGQEPTTGPTGGSEAIRLPLGAEGDDLVDTSFASDPLIEEPVTSGSETGLWECERDHEGRCEVPHE